MSTWYAVLTKPRREALAAANLKTGVAVVIGSPRKGEARSLGGLPSSPAAGKRFESNPVSASCLVKHCD